MEFGFTKTLSLLLILLFFVCSTEGYYCQTGYYDTCRNGYYCCNRNTACCPFGDLCHQTSVTEKYCKQGYHCCGYLDQSCCPDRSYNYNAVPAKTVSITGVLISSVTAFVVTKGNGPLV